MYRVFDDKFANTTTVIIQVLDVNDNAPRFDNAIYNVTDIQEEERGISKNNHKYLLTVCFGLLSPLRKIGPCAHPHKFVQLFNVFIYK